MSDIIKDGDTVRLVIEGPWRGDPYAAPRHDGDVVTATSDWQFGAGIGDTVTIEKVEPPVEQFKPGDIVRQKDTGFKFVHVLSDTGYTTLSTGKFYPYDDAVGLDFFTSEDFERVEVGA